MSAMLCNIPLPENVRRLMFRFLHRRCITEPGDVSTIEIISKEIGVSDDVAQHSIARKCAAFGLFRFLHRRGRSGV